MQTIVSFINVITMNKIEIENPEGIPFPPHRHWNRTLSGIQSHHDIDTSCDSVRNLNLHSAFAAMRVGVTKGLNFKECSVPVSVSVRVSRLEGTFSGASVSNQDIRSWNVSSAQSMKMNLSDALSISWDLTP